MKDLEIAGKKIFAVPAYKTLLTNYPAVSSCQSQFVM